MEISLITTLLGGLGLFLLGMHLMTEGLGLAAGRTLRSILVASTRTPVLGLLSGTLITSIVQSSSAVTVATIGFVNAGLLNIRQAVTLIFGSNIGTTMTGWLVALIGIRFHIEAFALPAIGIGMLLRMLSHQAKRQSLGEAIAGFGVFFLGIGVLKSGFGGFSDDMMLDAGFQGGIASLFLFVLVGFLLTFLMQSSSAAIALTLTAAGNVLPLETAAAVVIGANVGTTTTAALAVIGATPNARRVAAAHVGFNLFTGLVALGILAMLLLLFPDWVEIKKLGPPATLLAVFHTTFNLLGVLLVWPVLDPLVRFLEKRFRAGEEDEARPRYLDRNTLATPLLAMQALIMELARIGKIARRAVQGVLSREQGPDPDLQYDRATILSLIQAAGEFSTRMQRSDLPGELDDALPNALRVSRYYLEAVNLADELSHQQARLSELSDPALARETADFKSEVATLVQHAAIEAEDYSQPACSEQLGKIQQAYQQLKAHFLRAGTEDRLSVQQMVEWLDHISHIRRIAEQLEKGARYLDDLKRPRPEGSADFTES